MPAAIEEVKAEGLRFGSAGAGDEGLVGGGDVGVGGLGEVGEEDVTPEGCAGGGVDVLNVEDVVAEVLIEDAWLDLEGGLRGFELVLEAEEIGGAARGEVESVDQADGRGR